MSEPSPLPLIMVEFLRWVADRPRTYGEAMSAWRTSCPRLSVWEDATLDGLVALTEGEDRVRLTERGRIALDTALGREGAVLRAAE